MFTHQLVIQINGGDEKDGKVNTSIDINVYSTDPKEVSAGEKMAYDDLLKWVTSLAEQVNTFVGEQAHAK